MTKTIQHIAPVDIDVPGNCLDAKLFKSKWQQVHFITSLTSTLFSDEVRIFREQVTDFSQINFA